MAASLDRDTIVRRLGAERKAGRMIYDALCGTGITAKMAARGGADMITTHALAYYRMQGLSSMAGYLPICDANALTLQLGEGPMMQVVGDCPLMAGLLGVDPTRDMHAFLDRIVAVGYSGVMCCPTITLIDGKFRSDLEETGMSFKREVELLGAASRKGVFTKAFCVTPDEALAMAEAGVDNIILHYGNSSGGSIGSSTVPDWTETVTRTTRVLDALAAKYADRFVTCHGGAIETAADFERLLRDEPRLDGYVGGSSAERFPIEASVPAASRGFKSIRRPGTR